MGRGGYHCEHDGMNDWWVGGWGIQGGGWVMPRRAMHGMYYFLVNQDEVFLSAADSNLLTWHAQRAFLPRSTRCNPTIACKASRQYLKVSFERTSVK